MGKGMMWILIVIALLVGLFGGYYYEKNKMTSSMMMMQDDLQKQLDSAKMKIDDLTKQEKGMMPTASPTGMMKEESSPTPTKAMKRY